MVIKFRRRTQSEYLIWILLLGPFFMALLTQMLHMPHAIKYIYDICCVALICLMLKSVRIKKIEKQALKLQNWILLFAVVTFIVYIINYQSIFYYIWGMRNNFRGYIVFLAVIYFLKEKNVYEIFEVFDKLFYLNAAVMIVQFLLLGYKQDNLGGVFGVESGCNAYVNLFFCIITIISYVKYTEHTIKFKKLFVQIFLMLILAALAELKFFYVEFIILIFVGTLVTQFSWKKLAVVLAAIFALMVGYGIFMSVFPDVDMSVNGLYEYASSDKGYTSSGDLNRLNFLPAINKKIFKNPINQIWGLGMGNCEYATGMDLLTTPFSKKYNYLHYEWMSTTFMYLENGWIGFLFFFGFFVQICVRCITELKKETIKNKTFFRIAFLCGIVAMMNAFYNVSLRMESCFMIYLLLAIPWCGKDRKENIDAKKVD